MSKVALFAYLAGAMDSDGCISVKRSTYAMRVRGDAAAPIFSERVFRRSFGAQICEPPIVRPGGFRIAYGHKRMEPLGSGTRRTHDTAIPETAQGFTPLVLLIGAVRLAGVA
jgi:hypothetical protein